MAVARKSKLRAAIPLVAVLGSVVACVVQSPRVRPFDTSKQGVFATTPVKVHLTDGSTIIYRYGVSVSGNRLNGAGQRYALGLSVPEAWGGTTLDSVVGVEVFDRNINVPGTIVASAFTAAGAAIGTAAALVAVFGSCPTFYADSAGTELLQAEGFSYSIAPILEQRDVDRLRLTVAPDGKVVMRVRNEALETHYINHLELIETVHEPDEVVLPDQGGRPIAILDARSPERARDRAGRDVAPALATSDDLLFASDAKTVERATASDLDDWIEMVISVPEGRDSVAILLDLRNSLLNTVLLYDHMLGPPGLKSIDFLGKELETISGAVELSRWYVSHMGMRFTVHDGTSWRPVARIGDSGPIAYEQLAVTLPALRGKDGNVRVRLSFVADNWRIDAIRTATTWRRPETRAIPPARIRMPDPAQNPGALASLLEPDETYLVTHPGVGFAVEFDAGQTSRARTFMLASQGYYSEWVRGSWIASASGKQFVPSSAALLDALRSWRARQEDMEHSFYSSRIAARTP